MNFCSMWQVFSILYLIVCVAPLCLVIDTAAFLLSRGRVSGQYTTSVVKYFLSDFIVNTTFHIMLLELHVTCSDITTAAARFLLILICVSWL